MEIATTKRPDSLASPARGLRVVRIDATGSPRPMVIVGCVFHVAAELAEAAADLERAGIEHAIERWALPECPGAFELGAMLVARFGSVCCPFCAELRAAL